MKTTKVASDWPKALRKLASFSELLKGFDTEERCISYLEQVRWPNGLVCIREGCGSRR
ncbi:MAG: transposase, partial [Blastocatellia bacterium]